MNQKLDSKKHKQERIPCPYCKELIIPGAIKCRFCGEKLSTNKQNVKEKRLFLSTRALYLIWLFCLIIFIIWSLFSTTDSSETWSDLIAIAVLIGIIVFLFLFHRVAQPKLFNNGKYGLITVLTFIAFFGIFLNQNEVRALLGLPSTTEVDQSVNTNQSNKITSPTPTPTKSVNQVNKGVNTVPKTNSNLIACTGPDGKVFKTTQKECDDFNTAWKNPPTPDPNEIIRCNISPNCGGGYKEMTRSSCDRLICCQINNSWELRDKKQCNKEQEQEEYAEWTQFCNNLHNPDSCSNYWQPGTIGLYNCRSDAYNNRIRCYDNY